MTPKQRGVRILVADDDASMRSLLDHALAHLGHTADLCDNGAAALQRAEPGAFDLFLFDYRMGPPDGVEVLERVRRNGGTTPVILMSSAFSDDVLRRCAGLPRVWLLEKPFSLVALRSAIDRALEL